MTITTIHWTRGMLASFKKAHGVALREHVPVFTFEGHEFAPAYAGYLIEYLESVALRLPSGTKLQPEPA